jgi:chaperonin GroES
MIEKKTEHMVQPIRAFVLIRLIPEGMSDGGIALPDGVRLKNRAQVVAIGSGHLTESGTIVPLEVKPGDFVIVHIPKGAPVIEQDRERGDLVVATEAMICAIDRRPPSVAAVVKAPRAVQ